MRSKDMCSGCLGVSYGLRRISMEDDFVDELVTPPKPAKSLMWYVSYIIAAGLVGISIALIYLEIV